MCYTICKANEKRLNMSTKIVNQETKQQKTHTLSEDTIKRIPKSY